MEVRFVVWKKEIYYLNLGFVKSYLDISVHENKNSMFFPFQDCKRLLQLFVVFCCWNLISAYLNILRISRKIVQAELSYKNL
jgi:hypothetical protein